MEQDMKNFDRFIEQRMNEHQVQPPFGAWNRIAAELDATPVAGVPGVNNYFPRQTVASFIAGALIMASAVATGFWVNSSFNSDKNTVKNDGIVKPVANTVMAAPVSSINKISNVNAAVSPAVSTPVEAKVTSGNIVHAVKKSAPVQPVAESAVLASRSAGVPAAIEAKSLPASDLKETYYFPPVDIMTPEKCKPASADEIKMAKVDDAKAAMDDDRGKVEHKRIHLKKHKPVDFGYGHINRM